MFELIIENCYENVLKFESFYVVKMKCYSGRSDCSFVDFVMQSVICYVITLAKEFVFASVCLCHVDWITRSWLRMHFLMFGSSWPGDKKLYCDVVCHLLAFVISGWYWKSQGRCSYWIVVAMYFLQSNTRGPSPVSHQALCFWSCVCPM